MVFNGITSHNYVRFVNEDRAIKILILWTVSVGILLLYTLEEMGKQLKRIIATTIESTWYIPH